MYFQFLFPDEEYSYILKEPNIVKNLKYFWIKTELGSCILFLMMHFSPRLDKKFTRD